MSTKRIVNYVIDEELISLIRIQAAIEDKTPSQLVNDLIRNYLKNHGAEV